MLAVETPPYGAGSTVFHAITQDAIQDDGGDSFVTATYVAWQGSSAGATLSTGSAFHQGGGMWRAEIPTQAGAAGAHLCWTFTDRNSNASTDSATAGTVDDWTDLGNGLAAGGGGVPTLTGSGSPQPGQSISIDLSGAAPNAGGALVVNASADYLSLFGGTFVPSLSGPAIFEFYTTDGAGSIATINAPWPSGPSDCTVLYFQAATIDGGAPGGFSYSNALAAIQK